MSDRIVLMNRGKIVQNGDAETLYTQPVNLFAAGFIGNYNLLSAAEATQLTGQPWYGQIAIRPESIQLCAPDNGIAADILSHSLLGNIIRYRVRAQGVELSVDVLNRSPDDLHAIGRKIGLQLELSTVRQVV